MTKYSVPSFGGHIDFSDDVTIYPVLSVVTISLHLVCLPAVSVQEILYLRCILGHKIGGIRAPKGLPNKHEC